MKSSKVRRKTKYAIRLLIAAAQKSKHYEIASYGTLATTAEQLGYSKALKLLKETLDEEKQTDLKLTDLAVSNVNKVLNANRNNITVSLA